MDLEKIRKIQASALKPGEWPDDVYSISLEGVSLLGVHKKTNALYWDGKEIVTKSVIRLRRYELILATMAAIGTLGSFLLALGQEFAWLGGSGVP